MTDHIKTSIFDLIREFISGAEVLDLFAGSGALGIEALSRGASQATFVDSDLSALQVIMQNLTQTKLQEQAVIKKANVRTFLEIPSQQYDLVFIDPPFAMPLELKMEVLSKSADFIKAEGIIVFRTPNQENNLTATGLDKVYQKTYGASTVGFFRKK